ncbi:MAG TPA: Lrp/AsnC family transcriptional regulator [Candidatus Nanoarchaeia archaeon]|nr:Lrp/AsnC family transcriptional regulator [Candidatus Nanoarchaeia archaeon]
MEQKNLETSQPAHCQHFLDIKDRKLLYYLSEDARSSYTALAKKLFLSKNAVKYRITRLQHKGVIKQFSSVLNFATLDKYTFTLLLKFNEDIYKRTDIITYFSKHPRVDWVIVLSGNWDIFAEFVCNNLFEISHTVDALLSTFHEVLNTYQVFLSNDPLRVEHSIDDLYSGLGLPVIRLKPRKIEHYAQDIIDKKILHALCTDASLHYLALSKQLGLTLDVVRYRVKLLFARGVIIKTFAELSLPKLGYTEYLYILRLRNVSQEKFSVLKHTITQNKNIEYAFLDKNSFNIIFVCAFQNSEGIDNLSRGLRRSFSDIIDSQEYLIVKDQLLFNLFPRGLVD